MKPIWQLGHHKPLHAIITAQAHASASPGSSQADNLLGFWSSGHNQTQCNNLESEVEAYLLDS
jgi:hypothetical protein